MAAFQDETWAYYFYKRIFYLPAKCILPSQASFYLDGRLLSKINCTLNHVKKQYKYEFVHGPQDIWLFNIFDGE